MDIEYLSRHKERYFRKAEKQAKVYIRPQLKKDTKEKMWKLALNMTDFHEIPYRKKYGETQVFYRGYFLFRTRKTENIKKSG